MKALRPYLDVILALVITVGFIIFQLGADWKEGAGVYLAILGAIVVVGAIATVIYDKLVTNRIDEPQTEIQQPAIARLLFHDTRSAPIWLAVRFYLGFAWLSAGYEKIAGNPSWFSTGKPLAGFWTNAIKTGQGTAHPAITYDWYRNLLQFMVDHHWETWFAKLIAGGELLVGIGIIVG
ncbi:MAG: hypothetical protein ACTHNK_01365, partial [Thermomicrobiales bacterium]